MSDINHKYLRGIPVRNRILDEVSAEIAQLDAQSPVGKLVSIAIGDTEEVEVYIRGQKRAAERAGIPFEEQHWPGDITAKEAKARLVTMNDAKDVIGVIIQRPVPSHLNVRSLQSAIHPLKDVEGMNPASIGNIMYNDIAMAPCTAAASVEMLKEARGQDLSGLEVVMIGHSEIVGKPAATMLIAQGATVTVCHHMTRSVAMHSRRAEAILVAVGRPKLITAEMVMPGAVVIDIGINSVTDPTTGETSIVGDADTDEVAKVAGWITPVPGGVGPVTTAMLMRNALNAVKKQRALGWS